MINIFVYSVNFNTKYILIITEKQPYGMEVTLANNAKADNKQILFTVTSTSFASFGEL